MRPLHASLKATCLNANCVDEKEIREEEKCGDEPCRDDGNSVAFILQASACFSTSSCPAGSHVVASMFMSVLSIRVLSGLISVNSVSMSVNPSSSVEGFGIPKCCSGENKNGHVINTFLCKVLYLETIPILKTT